MALTIEVPDEVADRARVLANARGVDLGTFAASAFIDAIDAQGDSVEEYDAETIAALREGIADADADRVFTLAEVGEHMEVALAEAVGRRGGPGISGGTIVRGHVAV